MPWIPADDWLARAERDFDEPSDAWIDVRAGLDDAPERPSCREDRCAKPIAAVGRCRLHLDRWLDGGQ